MHGIGVANELLRECAERIAEVSAELRANPLHAVGAMDADGVRDFLQNMPADVRVELLNSALTLIASAAANGFAKCRWSLYSGDEDSDDDCPFDKSSMVSIDIL